MSMNTVKINNLQRWITEIHLKDYFTNCGMVIEAKVGLDPDTLRQLGYGSVTFADEMGVKRALAKNGSLLDGAKIEVILESEQQTEEVALG